MIVTIVYWFFNELDMVVLYVTTTLVKSITVSHPCVSIGEPLVKYMNIEYHTDGLRRNL